MAICVQMPFHGCPDVHKHISLWLVLGLVSGLENVLIENVDCCCKWLVCIIPLDKRAYILMV